MSTTSKVTYFVWGVLWGSKQNGQGYDPDWFNSFATEVVEGFRWLFQLLSVISHFSNVERKSISAWLPLSMRILVTFYLSMWTVITMASVCGNEARLISWGENVIGIWDHLVLIIGPSMA
jgi:hypothetical protein